MADNPAADQRLCLSNFVSIKNQFLDFLTILISVKLDLY